VPLLLSANTKVQFRPFIASAYVSAGALMMLIRPSRMVGFLCAAAGLITWIVASRIPNLPMPLQEPLTTTGMGNTADTIMHSVALVTDPTVRMAVVE
jgi:hypothetical protein